MQVAPSPKERVPPSTRTDTAGLTREGGTARFTGRDSILPGGASGDGQGVFAVRTETRIGKGLRVITGQD